MPLTISYPITRTAQLVAGADGRGNVVLVWRVVSRDEVFYQSSSDAGRTWSRPGAIPGIYARTWDTPFDMYSIATDSAGYMHLMLAGRTSTEEGALIGVYHLAWDGNRWSPPRGVYTGLGYPEYPELVVSEGNHLHAVWTVRDSIWETQGNYEVWYSDCFSAASRATPLPSIAPLPTATATPEPTAIPLPSARPTLMPPSQQPTSKYSESSQVLRVALALSPMLLVLIYVAVREAYRRRGR